MWGCNVVLIGQASHRAGGITWDKDISIYGSLQSQLSQNQKTSLKWRTGTVERPLCKFLTTCQAQVSTCSLPPRCGCTAEGMMAGEGLSTHSQTGWSDPKTGGMGSTCLCGQLCKAETTARSKQGTGDVVCECWMEGFKTWKPWWALGFAFITLAKSVASGEVVKAACINSLVLRKTEKSGETAAYNEDAEMWSGGRTLRVCPESSEILSGQMRSPFKKQWFLYFQNEIQILIM